MENNLSREQLILEIERLKNKMTEYETELESLRERNELLEEHKDGYHQFFDNFAVAVGISSVEGKVFAINKAMEELMGYSIDEFKKINLIEVYTNQSDRQVIIKELEKTGSLTDYKIQLTKKNGKVFWAKVTYRIFEFNGQSLILTTAFDINEQKIAEDSIEEKDRLLHDVEIIAQIGGWEMDLEQNGEATWTRGTYDILELDYDKPAPGLNEHLDWYLPEYREMIKNKMSDLIENQTPMKFEAMVKTKTGKLKWCQAIGETVVEDGKIIKVRGVFQDISVRKQSEENLHKSKILLEAAIESPSDMIIVFLDKDYKYLYFNKTHAESMLNIYGTKPDIGNCIFEYMTSEEDVTKIKEHYDLALSGEGHIAIESYGGGDSEFVYEIRYNPIYDEKHEILGITSFSKDITERIQSEQKLKRFSNIFKQSINEIMLFEPDTLKFLQANNAALNNLGYSAKEILKLTPIDIKPRFTKEKFEDLILPLRKNEKEKIVFETIHKRKDGTYYDVEVHLQLMRFEHTELFSAIILDVTDRKQAEVALIQSEERFRLALDNIPDIVVIYDRDLRIQYINSAAIKLTGRPISDYIGKKEEELWPPEVYNNYLSTLKEAYTTHKTSSIDIKINISKDIENDWQITYVPILNDRGEVREILGITHDFTRFKNAERELKKHRDNLEALVKERTEELEKKNKELDNTLKVFVGRELTIKDLQRRINALEGKSDFENPSK